MTSQRFELPEGVETRRAPARGDAEMLAPMQVKSKKESSQMRVLVLTPNLIPYPTGFGSAVHVWSLVRTLLELGHEVHLCCYDFSPERQKAEWVNGDYRVTIQELTRRGVKVHLIDHREPVPSTVWAGRLDLVRKALVPALSDFYAGPAYSRAISDLVVKIRPDALFVWTVDAVAATRGMAKGAIPRLAFLTDLDHLANSFRRRYRQADSFKAKLYKTVGGLADRRLPGTTTRLLAGCEAVVDHAAHHCEWLRGQGLSHARYLPVPVLDQAGPGWQAARSQALEGNAAPKISLIGNVRGIATLAGLYLFAREVLPEIENSFADSAEVHVIGGGKLPTDLVKMLDRPFVKIRGFVEDIHAEFRSSDVFLVPTPIDLGFRTRIAEAFSFGCCVVAHDANALGMPELRHEDNTLLASTGRGLTKALMRCLKSVELRERLGARARMTFERELDGSLVSRQMIDTIQGFVANDSVRAGIVSGKADDRSSLHRPQPRLNSNPTL